jgi:hypothetical protein
MRKLIVALLAIIVCLAVWGVGIVPPSFGVTYLWLVLVGVGVWLVISLFKPKLAANLMIPLMSIAVSLIFLDLSIRIMFRDQLYYRPHDMFLHRWPRMPLVSRFTADVDYAGETYGDLAAMSGERSYREHREMTFKTDAYGFRNVTTPGQSYDVIIVGDSFGEGTGTTQEATWATLLADRYGLSVYNLSLPDNSPWQGYINLTTEIERLNTHPGAVLLLLIFPGNDLEELYSPLAIEELPWFDSWFDRLQVSAVTFRNRSPIQQMFFQAKLSQSPETLAYYKNLVISKPFINNKPMLFYRPYVENSGLSAQEITGHRNYAHFNQTLLDIKAFADRHCLTLKIALIPAKSEVYSWVLDETTPWSTKTTPSDFSEIMRDYAEQHDVQFLDLKPALVQSARQAYEESGDVIWWYDDTHWNPTGHVLVAATVFEELLGEEQNSPELCD